MIEIGSVGIVPCSADVDDRRDVQVGEIPLEFVERPLPVANGPNSGGQTSLPSSFVKAGQMS